MGGQLDELLASLAARCRVCLQSWLYCILVFSLFITRRRWQINVIMLIFLHTVL